MELREIRNELEHDYPENLKKVLENLKFCMDYFETLKQYYLNSLSFAEKF